MKIKNLFPVILFFIISSCNKGTLEEQLISESNSNLRENGDYKTTDSSGYFLELASPVRDVLLHVRAGGRLPVTKYLRDVKSHAPKLVNNTYPYACGDPNTPLIITAPIGWGSLTSNQTSVSRVQNLIDDPYYIFDPFSNPINAIGVYGTQDDRQAYYVYCPPTANSNSPVVVLIHGGAWYSGPNFEIINGWPVKFAGVNENTSLVKNLMDNGFVVVSLLYRLAQYDESITGSQIHIQDQINDINSAILHIRSTFPSCFNINANSIQVLGESAGGHLATMWAYTQSNTSYVKSVVSLYAPTNLNHFGRYLKDDRSTPTFTCGGNFRIGNMYQPPAPASDFPFYFGFRINNDTSVYASVQPFSCTIDSIITYFSTYNLFTQTWTHTPIKSQANQFLRVLDLYKMMQSCVKQIITNPYTNSTLSTYSPKDAANSSKNIPTFIMHGKVDQLVPYRWSAGGMKNKLNSLGGIDSLPNTSSVLPTSFPTTPKHYMKMYDNGNHTMAGANLTQVRADIIKWFNGHK